MNNKQLQKTMNEVGLTQSDLARLIYDTNEITISHRVMISRYLTGKHKVPNWLVALLKIYRKLNKYEQTTNN